MMNMFYEKYLFFSTYKDNIINKLNGLILLQSIFSIVLAIYILTIVYEISYKISNFIYDRLHAKKILSCIPGPNGIPLFGMIPSTLYNLTRFFEWREELVHRYGKTMKIPTDLFHNGTILTHCPKNIEHILSKNFNNYIKPPIMCDAFNEFLGESIFTINHAHTLDNGELWRYQRKLLARVFSTNNFRHFSTNVFNIHINHMIQQLNELSNAPNNRFDMEKLCIQFTSKSTYTIGFGLNLPTEYDHNNFHEIFRRVNELCTHRFLKPWYRYFKWCMPSEYEIRKHLKYMDKIIYGIINERSHNDMNLLINKYDMLSVFLLKSKQDNKKISFKLLRDIIMAIYSAGRDTTACGIGWILYEVAKYPIIEEKIINEIQSIYTNKSNNDNNNNTLLTYEDIHKLTYLDAVINEVWRLYPPLPIEMKYSYQDDILPDNTHVPAKTRIEFSARIMGRMESIWGKDVLEFNPDRWLHMKTKPTAYTLPIFQAGPRICLGQRMAFIQTKLLLSNLYYSFTFKNIEKSGTKPEYNLSTALFKKGGILMNVQKRNKIDKKELVL